MRPQKPKVLVHAESLVQAWLTRLGYDTDAFAVFDIWDRLAGPRGGHATGLKGKKLCVEVASSVHMHDLILRKKLLLTKLNQHFGTRLVISDIIFELAGRRENGPAAPKQNPQEAFSAQNRGQARG